MPDSQLCPDERLAAIRLLATDLDGTLLGPRGQIAERTMMAWTAWKHKGGLAAIVTGRPFANLVQVITERGGGATWPLPDALICDERDVYIVDPDCASPTWHPVPHPVRNLTNEREQLALADEIVQKLMARARASGSEPKRSEPEAEMTRGYVELRYPESEAAEAGRRLASSLLQNHAAALIPVRNSRLLSLRHPLSRKGFALAHLVEHLGLLMSQAVAVGDSLNDLTMLDGSCGNLTAAVPNADPLVLAATQAAGGILLEEPATLGVASLFEALVAASSLRR
jgi:hydroxymethylpyrimidine pyrophosphatase-like HAD family hydrolase